MLFYKYTYSINGEMIENETQTDVNNKRFSRCLNPEARECAEFCDVLKDIKFYILNKTERGIIFLCAFYGGLNEIDKIDLLAQELVLKLGLDMIMCQRLEISLSQFIQELNICEDNCNIVSSRDVKWQLDLFFNEIWFKERKFIQKTFTKEETLQMCEGLVVDAELKREVERIYQNSQDNSFGVPVQYFVNIANDDEREKVVQILLNSLKSNNRSIRNYYSMIDLSAKDNYGRMSEVDRAFKINNGGVVVINGNYNIEEDEVMSREHMITEIFAGQIYAHASNVTSIICCRHKSQEKIFKENLTDLLLVEINDTTISNDRARDYLKKYAESLNINKIDGLLEMIDEDIAYKVDDLITIFNKWHKGYIKNIQYPQYANLQEQEQIIKEEKKEIAIDLLNEMVGLEQIKQTIDNYLNYSQLQKACLENGIVAKNTCRHMCFVGNPGTAKTTVARYVAQIMKQKGLLTNGNLIEVGRGDIVSRYVGGTAPNVQQIFRKAMGNVLFIDEAYSLCDGKEGMYGDEAINAIVQEMENKREDVVVIFAGYKNEMEKFLNKNSGLKSRIASIIEFPDYTEEELLGIANVQAKKMDIDISQCEEKIKNIITLSKNNEKNFGNGRFVRNILEKARMQQASRLVREDKMYGENLKILKPEDFEVPIYQQKISMGFC